MTTATTRGALMPAALTLNITLAKPVQLSKANARDINEARQALSFGLDGQRIYAASLSGIHRSSSALQQMAIEAAIQDDGLGHLFRRHPVNGCLLSAGDEQRGYGAATHDVARANGRA